MSTMEQKDEPTEYQQALARLVDEFTEGLEHGFFSFMVAGELVKGRKRRVTITAGKSYQFTFPEDELPREPWT